MGDEMVFRPARGIDSDMLLRWRNDQVTRRQSRNMEPVSPDEHIAWLASHRPVIAVEDGVPVGTVRCENGEMSWTVAPEHRGRGVGERMVTGFAALFEGRLTAEIKPQNIVSRAIARAAGFSLIMEHYERP